MNDSTDFTPDERAALTEAATLILVEMRANPGSEVEILVRSLMMCGSAAAKQGLTAVLNMRERAALVVSSITMLDTEQRIHVATRIRALDVEEG